MHPTDILLVEDNPGDVSLWLEAFSASGLRQDAVAVASDGCVALTLLERGMAEHRLPRLVITDSSLPVMSGPELAIHVHGHQQLKHLPVVIVTGILPPAAKAEASALIWYEKPNDFDALCDLARRLSVRYLAAITGIAGRDPHPSA